MGGWSCGRGRGLRSVWWHRGARRTGAPAATPVAKPGRRSRSGGSRCVWQGVIAGAKEEAPKLGNVTIKADAPQNEEDIQGQISKIQDLISGGANELIVAPDGDALKPVLQQAASKGILVVLIDTDIASFSQKTSYVSSVQDTSSADVVGVSIKALGSAAKGAEVGILDFPGNNTVQARVDAAKKAYEAAGMKVVAQLPGKCDRATALNATTDMLQAHPNIKAIFGGCGQGATGLHWRQKTPASRSRSPDLTASPVSSRTSRTARWSPRCCRTSRRSARRRSTPQSTRITRSRSRSPT